MATEKATELSELVRDKAEQVRSQAAAKAEDVRGQVADKAIDMRDQLAARTQDVRGQLADNTPDQVREAVAKGAAGIRERGVPVALALGALAVALLIVRRLRSR